MLVQWSKVPPRCQQNRSPHLRDSAVGPIIEGRVWLSTMPQLSSKRLEDDWHSDPFVLYKTATPWDRIMSRGGRKWWWGSVYVYIKLGQAHQHSRRNWVRVGRYWRQRQRQRRPPTKTILRSIPEGGSIPLHRDTTIFGRVRCRWCRVCACVIETEDTANNNRVSALGFSFWRV